MDCILICILDASPDKIQPVTVVLPALIPLCITFLPAQICTQSIRSLLHKLIPNLETGCQSPLPECTPHFYGWYSWSSLCLAWQGGAKPPLSLCHPGRSHLQSSTWELSCSLMPPKSQAHNSHSPKGLLTLLHSRDSTKRVLGCAARQSNRKTRFC